MNLIGHLLPPPPHPSPCKPSTTTASHLPLQPILFSNLLSVALTIALNSPLPSLAIPPLSSQSPPLPPTTPFAQSKFLQLGLEDGSVLTPSSYPHHLSITFFLMIWFLLRRKIRPCPSVNPSCISTNPKSSSFAFPWRIPENATDDTIQVLIHII